MNIDNMIDKYINIGYEQADAEAKVCQDIILIKVSNSNFSKKCHN